MALLTFVVINKLWLNKLWIFKRLFITVVSSTFLRKILNHPCYKLPTHLISARRAIVHWRKYERENVKQSNCNAPMMPFFLKANKTFIFHDHKSAFHWMLMLLATTSKPKRNLQISRTKTSSSWDSTQGLAQSRPYIIGYLLVPNDVSVSPHCPYDD